MLNIQFSESIPERCIAKSRTPIGIKLLRLSLQKRNRAKFARLLIGFLLSSAYTKQKISGKVGAFSSCQIIPRIRNSRSVVNGNANPYPLLLAVGSFRFRYPEV